MIRDSVADLGLPLSRLEQRRHRVEELFRTDPALAGTVPDSGAMGVSSAS